MIIVNGFQMLTIIAKCSILDVAAVLDLLLNHGISYCCVGIESQFEVQFDVHFKEFTESVSARLLEKKKHGIQNLNFALISSMN